MACNGGGGRAKFGATSMSAELGPGLVTTVVSS